MLVFVRETVRNRTGRELTCLSMISQCLCQTIRICEIYEETQVISLQWLAQRIPAALEGVAMLTVTQ
jgi:hypothetical protein